MAAADLDERYGTGAGCCWPKPISRPSCCASTSATATSATWRFTFRSLPRLFAAFADETATPIVDIVRRSAGIPPACQWAVFLRNHDDLSLSALGAAENDRLMDVYAPDDSMRLHGGIRRRLAPMLGHDPRRIELAHALLLLVARARRSSITATKSG